MPLDDIYASGKEKMEKALAQLKKELASVRTGRANPLILEKVMVDYYGAPTPMRQIAQVTVQDGTTLVITPFDKSAMKDIEKAIVKAEIGITPNNDGSAIRLSFPPLTEDKRKELTKEVKAFAEEAKVNVRNVRRDMADAAKKAEKDENLSEDAIKDALDKIQKITDGYTKQADEIAAAKEKEVMTL